MSDQKIIVLEEYIEEKQTKELNKRLIEDNIFLKQQISILLQENSKFAEEIRHLIQLLYESNIQIIR